jgi:hypothetical protein
LSIPGRDLHILLAYLDINPEWWHSRIVPELRRQWQRLDAAHAAAGCGHRAIRHELPWVKLQAGLRL